MNPKTANTIAGPRIAMILAAGFSLMTLLGCGNTALLTNLLGGASNSVTVRLVNETAFTVKPEVFVSSIEGLGGSDFLGGLLDSINEQLLAIGINRQNFDNLSPGQTVDRTYNCNDIAAVMASNAELKSGLGISPEDSTRVFQMDRDFRCGDTVIITYSGGLNGFSARISTAPLGLGLLLNLLGG